MAIAATQGDPGETGVAGERRPPHRLRAELAEAPAVGPLAASEHPADRDREQDEQPERAEGGPPG